MNKAPMEESDLIALHVVARNLGHALLYLQNTDPSLDQKNAARQDVYSAILLLERLIENDCTAEQRCWCHGKNRKTTHECGACGRMLCEGCCGACLTDCQEEG